MSMELVYTSAPQGLRAGSGGFCTVAATAGMSRQMMMKLEALSGYDFMFGLSDPRANENPINFAHSLVTIGSETRGVLSRVGFAGADYSGRSNKIAHHVLLSRGEQLHMGPAAMLIAMRETMLKTRWEGRAANLPERDIRHISDKSQLPTEAWKRAAGDAGWAGDLIRAWRQDRRTPAFVIYEPGLDVLALFSESMNLLPLEERWEVTFATSYGAGAASTTGQCHWRGVAKGSGAAKEIYRYPRATVIDLTQPLEAPVDDEYTSAARMGVIVPAAASPDAGEVAVLLDDASGASPYSLSSAERGTTMWDFGRATAAGDRERRKRQPDSTRWRLAAMILATVVVALAGLSTWLGIRLRTEHRLASGKAPLVKPISGEGASPGHSQPGNTPGIAPAVPALSTDSFATPPQVANPGDGSATPRPAQGDGDAAEPTSPAEVVGPSDESPALKVFTEPEAEQFTRHTAEAQDPERKKQNRDRKKKAVFKIPHVLGFVAPEPFRDRTTTGELIAPGVFAVKWSENTKPTSVLSCSIDRKSGIVVLEQTVPDDSDPIYSDVAFNMTIGIVATGENEEECIYLCSLSECIRYQVSLGLGGDEVLSPEESYDVKYPWPQTLAWQWEGQPVQLGKEGEWTLKEAENQVFFRYSLSRKSSSNWEVKLETNLSSRLSELRPSKSAGQATPGQLGNAAPKEDKARLLADSVQQQMGKNLQLVDPAGRCIVEFRIKIVYAPGEE